MNKREFAKYLQDKRRLVEDRLDRILPPESRPPRILHRAMRLSVLAPAKRVRPILCLSACRAVGGKEEAAIRSACALELIHTYSLIHDDLPSMDDADLRRGQPACHKAFGEAIAILAGDALLALAFSLVAGDKLLSDRQCRRIVDELARAAGPAGMVGGQAKDLLAEGKKINQAELVSLHAAKTGALITAALLTGGISGDAGAEELEILRGYGEAIGLSFQIRDDILDVTGEKKNLGKKTGRDLEAGKATFPGLFGLETSRRRLEELTARARATISPLGPEAGPLCRLADFLAWRKS